MVYSSTLFNTDPYWDDYDEEKKFLRMLFKPGRAVQGRELTQLQTIVQDQIKRFGDHVFKNGSRVLGGELTNQDVTFLRVYTTEQVNSTDLDVQSLIGTDIVSNTALGNDTRRAKVLHGITGGTSDNDNYYVLMVQYVDGGGDFGSEFAPGDVVRGTTGTNTYIIKLGVTSGVAATDAATVNGITGTAKLTTVQNGIFFVDGSFVKNDTQSVSPFSLTGASSNVRDFGSPTSRIGFDIEKTIVEHTEDFTLRDPASGSFNYNAPGADRYKVDLKLDYKNFVNDSSYGASGFGDPDFIDLVRFVDGNLKATTNFNQYSEIEKNLARRTYDESGSYTTKPFEIDIRESLSGLGGPFSSTEGGGETLAAVGLQPGKAYVFGYEYETQGTQYVLVDKARTTQTQTSKPVNDALYGQFIKVSPKANMSLTGGFGELLATNYPLIQLKDGGGVTGDARVRQIIPNNDFGTSGMTAIAQTYNMYLFDINLNGITAFGNVTTVGETSLGAGSLTAGFVIGTGGTAGTSGGTGGTILFQPGFNTSLFPLPVGNSVNSVSDLTYRIYKGFTFSTSDATAVTTVSSGSDAMTFVGTTDPTDNDSYFPTDKRSFYTLICDDGGEDSKGRSGERVLTDTIQFKPASDKKSIEIGHASTATKQLAPGNYSLIATVDVASPFLFRKKTKTTGTTSYSVDNGASVSLSGTTGSYFVPLDHHDVIDVTSVVDNNNTVSNAVGLPASDVKDAFLLDNGQRDNYYDFGRLYLKPDLGVDAITGDINLTINYDRFSHASGEGPFVVDSYTHSTSGFTFDNIPIYISPKTGKSFSLRNCIDFRGTKQSDGTIKPDGLSIKSSSDFRADYTHHLSRIDKIVLTKERKFDVIKGIPALNPITPPDRADAMTLYVITVPAYTYNVDDISTKYIENRRYTMRDIGAIEKRVETLEYYTSLSLLEQQTENRSFIDNDGNDTFKNGILVDAFRGHSVGDVLNSDYDCSIDFENGHLRPPFIAKNVKLDNHSNSGITISPDGIVTLNYETNPQFVWQPFASDFVKVNPFNVPNFMGHIEFDDPFDNWWDENYKPTVKINTQGENDRWKVKNENTSFGFGTQWNDWEVIWSGRNITESDLYGDRGREFLNNITTAELNRNIEQRVSVANDAAIRSTETIKNNQGRVGIRIRKLPQRLEKLVNDRIVDASVVPYMRSKNVTFSAYGLKPNTTFYPYFDGVSVASHCGPSGGASGDTITSGSSGEIENAFFSIPLGTFKSGEKLFRLTDSSTDTLSETTTAADAIYYSAGTVDQRDGTLVSTRPISTRRQVVNDDAIVRDAFDRDIYYNTVTNNLWLDPLAQTFTVSSSDFEDGLFLDSIDLFFQRRSVNVPITLEIRPTLNGYPHLSKVLPLSSVSLIPEESEIREDFPEASTFTRFNFTSPLYLTPGEYAICLRTSSQDYNLYKATIGQNDLNSGAYISEQPASGSLFVPQNTGISTNNPSESLMYRVNTCKFDLSGSIETRVPSSEFTAESLTNSKVDNFKIVSGEHSPRSTTLSSRVNLGTILSNTDIITNENIYLESPATLTSNSDFSLTSIFDSSNVNVSPVIDLKRLDLVSVHNDINNSTDTSTNGELNASSNSSDSSLYGPGTDNPNSTAGAAARYITRRVTLEDGFESKNFKVIMSVNKPAEATVQVFVKPLGVEDATSFEEATFTQMTADSTISNSGNDYDFTEAVFSLSSNFTNPVKTFAIKICLYSSSSTKVPLVKDLRVIALQG